MTNVGRPVKSVEKLEIRELEIFCEQRKLQRIHTGLGATRYQRSPHGRSRNLATPLKAWMGSTHFLTKTLEKVKTGMSLQVLAYNMKRMINIFGVKPLMQAIAH